MNNRLRVGRASGSFSKRQWIVASFVMIAAFIAGSVLVILPQSFAAHASGASIKVTPPFANYSNENSVHVAGTNFEASEIVNVYWNYTGPGTGTLELAVTSDATGAFTAHFPTPLAPTALYTIAAIGQSSGFIATGTYKLLPQIYFSPQAGGPGIALFAFGNAYAANENVNIYWNYTGPGTGTLLTTVQGNSTGSFKTTIRVPSGTPAATVPIAGVGQSSNATAKFNFILYNPLLTLAPVSGSANTLLTVSGVGFSGYEKVNVYWNNGTTVMTSGNTSTFGYLSPATFTIPAGTAPGSYTVKAVGAKSRATITNTFTVAAPGSIFNSMSGPVGSKVPISVFGYAPGEPLNIIWNYTGPGTGITIATATAGNAGTINTSFLVPAAASGTYPVAVVGTISQFVTHHGFTVGNSLAIDPASSSPGTSITVTGTGYLASESVNLFLDSSTGTLLGTAQADSNGNINQAVTLPTSATPGAHGIVGIGQSSGQSLSASLSIDTSWGNFGFDSVNDRQNPYEYGVGTGNVANLHLKWSVPTALGQRGSPVYANGTVYIGTHNGILNAYNATTGAVKWVFDSKTAFEVPSSPLVDPANNLVFFGTMGFENSGIPSPFYALNASTGAFVWSIILPWNNFGFPSLAFNTIYIGGSHEGGNAMLNAIDELSGRILWQHPTSGGVWGAVAADTSAGTVFTGVGNPSNYVISLNASTGNVNWTFVVPNSGTDDDPGSAITIYNGLVYVDSKNGSVYALHENDGSLAWTRSIGPLNTGNVSSLAVGANGTLYVGSHDDNLYALDPANGNILWKTPATKGIDSSPAIANGVAYFASFDKNIYAVDATSGTLLWHFTTNNQSYSSPIIVNGWLYCASSDGKLYAFSL